MPKKTTTTSRRSTSSSRSSSRKKSNSLKIKQRFSVFQVVIVALVIAVVAIGGAKYTGGDSSNALSLTTIGSPQAGLTGYASASTGSTNTIGKLTLVGTGLTSVKTISLGNTSVPVTSVSNSNGTQTITANIPSGSLTCTQATATCNPSASSPQQCTAKTATCNPSSPSSVPPKCATNTGTCNVPPTSSTGEVTATPLGTNGSAVGNVTGISTTATPTIDSVNVAGKSAIIRGSGLLPGMKVKIGRSTVTGTILSTNSDGTVNVGATVNTNSCLLSSVPFLNRLCSNAKVGANQASVTNPDGSSSNKISVSLGKSTAAPVAASGALSQIGQGGGSSGGGSSGGSGGFCTPSVCIGNNGQQSATCAGSSFNGTTASANNAGSNGTVKWLSPKAGDVWNYGTAFTFSWQNPGTQITPPTNGVITNASGLAQVTLLGGCVHYNIQHYLDGDAEGAALAKAADPDNDATWDGHAWTENENGADGCGTDPGGSSNCDTDDNFRAWSAGTDTSDQDGASNHMLCFGVLPSGGRYNDPNVGVSGATVTVSVSSCVFGRPPSGTYKAWVQVYGLSGPAVCTPGHRCSGLPTKIAQAADGVSDSFQIN